MSFQSVRKYACKEDWNEEKLPNLEAENDPAGSGRQTLEKAFTTMAKARNRKTVC